MDLQLKVPRGTTQVRREVALMKIDWDAGKVEVEISRSNDGLPMVEATCDADTTALQQIYTDIGNARTCEVRLQAVKGGQGVPSGDRVLTAVTEIMWPVGLRLWNVQLKY